MLCSASQLFGVSLRQSRILLTRNAATISAPKEKWDLYVGVLVERLPIVSKTLKPIEKGFQELLWRIEFENSLKSDFELKHERDLVQAELIKKGQIEVDLDDTSKQTAQDLIDAYIEELKKHQIASRITADDKSNNIKSINRCLEDTLYLLVEHKLGKQAHLLLPQGERVEGETLRQTAERVLRERCGEALQVKFYGNAPCGFYKYKYPGALRKESVGVKLFFYRATLQNGNVDDVVASTYEWQPKEALDKKLTTPAYSESVQKFLF